MQAYLATLQDVPICPSALLLASRLYLPCSPLFLQSARFTPHKTHPLLPHSLTPRPFSHNRSQSNPPCDTYFPMETYAHRIHTRYLLTLSHTTLCIR
jgi:hypothetical protein